MPGHPVLPVVVVVVGLVGVVEVRVCLPPRRRRAWGQARSTRPRWRVGVPAPLRVVPVGLVVVVVVRGLPHQVLVVNFYWW